MRQKLSAKDEAAARKAITGGEKVSIVATRYGVTPACIYQRIPGGLRKNAKAKKSLTAAVKAAAKPVKRGAVR